MSRTYPKNHVRIPVKEELVVVRNGGSVSIVGDTQRLDRETALLLAKCVEVASKEDVDDVSLEDVPDPEF